MGESRRELLGVEARIERHENGPELEHGIRQSDVFAHIAETDSHAVAFFDPKRPQRVGERIGQSMKLTIRQGPRLWLCVRPYGLLYRCSGNDGWPVSMLRDDRGEVLGNCLSEQWWLQSTVLVRAWDGRVVCRHTSLEPSMRLSLDVDKVAIWPGHGRPRIGRPCNALEQPPKGSCWPRLARRATTPANCCIASIARKYQSLRLPKTVLYVWEQTL